MKVLYDWDLVHSKPRDCEKTNLARIVGSSFRTLEHLKSKIKLKISIGELNAPNFQISISEILDASLMLVEKNWGQQKSACLTTLNSWGRGFDSCQSWAFFFFLLISWVINQWNVLSQCNLWRSSLIAAQWAFKMTRKVENTNFVIFSGSKTDPAHLRGKTFGRLPRRVFPSEPDQPNRAHHDAEQESRTGNVLKKSLSCCCSVNLFP